MRENAFGEKVLQPNDSYQGLEKAWEAKFAELPEISEIIVEIIPEFDEVYKIGGEFRDVTSGEGIGFDGFASIDGAGAWLENNLDIPDGQIEVLEEE